MGYGKDFWNGNITDCQNYQLSPFGMTIDQLREYKVGKVFESAGGVPAYEKYDQVFHS